MREVDYWIDLAIRRRTVFLQAAGIVLGLVVLGTLLWPPSYQSSAEILVQDNRAQFLVSPEIQDNPNSGKPAVVVNPVSEQGLNSERELITSLFLVREAVANVPSIPSEGPSAVMFKALTLPLDLPRMGYEALHGVAAPSARDLWATRLADHLKTNLIKRSNIIEVDFTSHDARWSQDFLTRLLNQYLSFHARISHDPQAEQFFNEQAKVLEARLRTSEENLREFQVRNGITDLDDQTHSLIERLSQLKLQRDQDGAQLSSANSRRPSCRE